MNKSYLFCFLAVIGTFLLLSKPSLAYHNKPYDQTMCGLCHPGGFSPDNKPDCIQCHTATAPPYSPEVAPLKGNHSNAVMGTNHATMESWNIDNDGNRFPITCTNCHNPHQHNGISADEISDPTYLLVEFSGNLVESANKETTLTISNVIVHDPAWADPTTWSSKTGPERGLVLISDQGGSFRTYKVLSTTNNTVTFRNDFTYFGPLGTFPLSLAYGQFIREEVEMSDETTTSVTFGGPKTMANDDDSSPGDGFDESPNGICQVCHTQTTHWNNDGSGANHFSGWRCTICHPHEQGFKASPPSLCSNNAETSPTHWDCNGTWGGDAVADNCGTCDNDPDNDCVADCNGTWGGTAIWDACHVCGGDSTTCEIDPDSEYYPVDRSGTVTVAETGLMWQQNTADITNNGGIDDNDKLNFNDAFNYCESLLFAGYTNWRLPTLGEFQGLVVCADIDGNTTKETPLAVGEFCEGDYVRPTIDNNIFESVAAYYWPNGGIINFVTGRALTTSNQSQLYYVRCVR